MGRKYTSIHIYGEDLEKVLAVIENHYINNSKELEMKKLCEDFKMRDPELYK